METDRILWLIFEIVVESHKRDGEYLASLDATSSIMNRLSMCVFLYVFNSLLFYWIDTIHTTINATFAKQAFGGGVDFGFMSSGGHKLFYGATFLVIFLVVCSCYLFFDLTHYPLLYDSRLFS